MRGTPLPVVPSRIKGRPSLLRRLRALLVAAASGVAVFDADEAVRRAASGSRLDSSMA